MKKATEIISCLHSKILKERAILRILESESFRDIFETCDDKEKIEYFIETLKLEDLKEWIKNKTKIEIENMPIYKLRVLAKDLEVKKYYLLSRDMLIYKIRQLG